MRKLLVILLVLGVVVGTAEIFAARFAERQIERRVADDVDAEVDAEVSSFPLVTRLLLIEEVRHLRVTLNDAAFGEITFDTLTVEAEGIELPRRRLLDRNLRPTAIDGGSVVAFLSTASLGEAVGVRLPTIEPTATSARLEAGTLTLEAPGAPPVSVAVPQEVLPCSAAGEVMVEGVRLRCEVAQIPPVVLDNLPR